MRFFDKVCHGMFYAVVVVAVGVLALRIVSTFEYRNAVAIAVAAEEPQQVRYAVTFSVDGETMTQTFWANDPAQALGQFVQQNPYVRYVDVVEVVEY